MSLAVAIANRALFSFFIALVVIGPAFVLHEVGHKLTAQAYGYWAEYRMWRQGLFLALIFSFSGFVFVAPGAVYFADGGFVSRKSREIIGRIGISGPLVNLGLGGAFMLLYFIGGPVVGMIGYLGVYINAWLAVFNLIPFGPLDGKKVLAWNKTYWALTLLAGIGLFLWIR